MRAVVRNLGVVIAPALGLGECEIFRAWCSSKQCDIWLERFEEMGDGEALGGCDLGVEIAVLEMRRGGAGWAVVSEVAA